MEWNGMEGGVRWRFYNFDFRVYQSADGLEWRAEEEEETSLLGFLELGRLGVLDDGLNPITMGLGCDLRLRLMGVSKNTIIKWAG